MKNVLLLETIPDEVLTKLKLACNVIEAFDYKTAIENPCPENISAIITRGKGQVDQNLITSNQELLAIARCGVGLDNVDVSSATLQQVKVINAPGSNSDTMAEHTFALLLTSVRNLYDSITAVKQDDWAWRNKYQGDEIRGKTLGMQRMQRAGRRKIFLAELPERAGYCFSWIIPLHSCGNFCYTAK